VGLHAWGQLPDSPRTAGVEQFVYLEDEAGPDTGETLLTNAEASFHQLARQPMIGAPLRLRHPNLAGIRKWHIKDFEHHLIFYTPHPDGVSIMRVPHAARD
jgi:toxin ParE1/3/4